MIYTVYALLLRHLRIIHTDTNYTYKKNAREYKNKKNVRIYRNKKTKEYLPTTFIIDGYFAGKSK